MRDATYHVGWQVFAAPADVGRIHFHQGVEQYLYFVGADPMDIFNFDCEIEFSVGDDPDHMESRTIDRPTVVRLPADIWHGPIRFLKMGTPILFQASFLSGAYGEIERDSDGRTAAPFSWLPAYNYLGDHVRLCKYRENQRCIFCGECFRL
jgi:hypothetical protein